MQIPYHSDLHSPDIYIFLELTLFPSSKTLYVILLLFPATTAPRRRRPDIHSTAEQGVFHGNNTWLPDGRCLSFGASFELEPAKETAHHRAEHFGVVLFLFHTVSPH